MNQYEVRECRTKDELKRVIDLRYRILREPWAQTYESATDGLERSCVNAYIEDETGVIACGRLQQNSDQIGQIRYMAVEERVRGKGLGRMILEYLEQRAGALGLVAIELQAREHAVPFYLKHDYDIREKSFLLWGQIQHFLMGKELT
jgi:GNAT superfamily N-acetyltransferase